MIRPTMSRAMAVYAVPRDLAWQCLRLLALRPCPDLPDDRRTAMWVTTVYLVMLALYRLLMVHNLWDVPQLAVNGLMAAILAYSGLYRALAAYSLLRMAETIAAMAIYSCMGVVSLASVFFSFWVWIAFTAYASRHGQ